MQESDILALVLLICLGVGLILAVVGVFIFNNSDWWNKM
jgi:uncharacterized protein (DUF2062 family)